MGFLTGLFGSNKPETSKNQSALTSEEIRQLTAATPDERDLLASLKSKLPGADQGVVDEMTALHGRGEDLSNVDQAYMQRAYQPGYERLMQDYSLMDQGVLENMNKRGIGGNPNSNSEPEDYARMLTGRDTKEKLSQNMLQAQNQAVNQKLNQYNARLGETEQANKRLGQIFDPYANSTIVPEATRQGTRASLEASRAGVGSQQYGAQLGYKTAQSNQQAGLVGAMAGMAGQAIASDVNVKKDFAPGPTSEEALDDVESIPVSRWRYQGEPSDSQPHTGGMAQDMPEDISPDGKSVDVVSYLGTLNQAVKGLKHKMQGFEQLLTQGGAQ
jgi:hypothetical protein